MTEPYLQDGGLTILCGDALALLREMPDESIDMALTSPPFFGLRDYGTGRWEGGDPDCLHRPDWKPRQDRNTGSLRSTAGTKMMGAESRGHRDGIFRDACRRCGAERIDEQIGLEQTPAEFVERLVQVFAEVRRVLRPWGCLLLEVGDSYASKRPGPQGFDKSTLSNPERQRRSRNRQKPPRPHFDGIKEKDLMGMPWTLAFALRADGWWLRGEYIWDKPNPMPESTLDRCTTSHSRVFHLTKAERYYWDKWAIAEEAVRAGATIPLGAKSFAKGQAAGKGVAPTGNGLEDEYLVPALRNARSVWRIPTEPSGLAICGVCRTFWERNAPLKHCGQEVTAHYAAFPVELASKAIKAASSEKGVCPDCGRPWERIVSEGEPELAANTWSPNGAQDQDELAAPSSTLKHVRATTTVGWQPGCDCGGVDLRTIHSPTGERIGEDPSLRTGRAGMNRPRGDDEGTRPMTRYEQARYAGQLKASPKRGEMIYEVGADAFSHYCRTDFPNGARAVPPDVLDRWIDQGWLERVEVPDIAPPEPVPATVLDPFGGSGTTLDAARRLGRHATMLELNADYCEIAARRLQIPAAIERAAATATEPTQLALGW